MAARSGTGVPFYVRKTHHVRKDILRNCVMAAAGLILAAICPVVDYGDRAAVVGSTVVFACWSLSSFSKLLRLRREYRDALAREVLDD